jgi:hypothetical protein
MTHIDVYCDDIRSNVPRDIILASCGNEDLKTISASAYAYELGEYKQYDIELLDRIGEGSVEDDLVYHRYSYEQGTLRQHPSDHGQVVATGKAIYDILHSSLFNEKGEKRKFWFDSDACYRIVTKYIKKEYRSSFSNREIRRRGWSVTTAKDIASISMAACRLGRTSLSRTLDVYQDCVDSDPDWRLMAAWNQAFEYLRMIGTTPELKNVMHALRDQDLDLEVKQFSIIETRGAKHSGAIEVYRILGHYVLVYEMDVYILDYSALDQVHACSKFWEGVFNYCVNYRLSGSLESAKSDMVFALKKSIIWVVSTMEDTIYDERVARSMKQSLAYLQNGIHAKAEKLDMGLANREKELGKMIEDILKLKVYWHELVNTLDITDRSKLDHAHLYYGLPAPDCDIELLVKRATEYMSKAKVANEEVFTEFMNYCKALDFCKVLVRVRALD